MQTNGRPRLFAEFRSDQVLVSLLLNGQTSRSTEELAIEDKETEIAITSKKATALVEGMPKNCSNDQATGR